MQEEKRQEKGESNCLPKASFVQGIPSTMLDVTIFRTLFYGEYLVNPYHLEVELLLPKPNPLNMVIGLVIL